MCHQARQHAHHERYAEESRELKFLLWRALLDHDQSPERSETRDKSGEQRHHGKLDEQGDKQDSERAVGCGTHGMIASPPPTKCTTSSRSPAWMTVCSQLPRAAITRFNSTATRSAGSFKNSSRPERVSPSGTSCAWPFTWMVINPESPG